MCLYNYSVSEYITSVANNKQDLSNHLRVSISTFLLLQCGKNFHESLL